MNLQDMSEKEVLDIANPIMDNLMQASTDINHKKHTQDFSYRLKNIVTKEHLENVCTQYQNEKGYFSKRETVAEFKRPDSLAVIWKQTFTKAKGEFVAEIVLINKNGRFLVDHAMVF